MWHQKEKEERPPTLVDPNPNPNPNLTTANSRRPSLCGVHVRCVLRCCTWRTPKRESVCTAVHLSGLFGEEHAIQHTHTHTHTRAHTHTRVRTHTHTHARVRAHTHTHIHSFIHSPHSSRHASSFRRPTNPNPNPNVSSFHRYLRTRGSDAVLGRPERRRRCAWCGRCGRERRGRMGPPGEGPAKRSVNQ